MKHLPVLAASLLALLLLGLAPTPSHAGGWPGTNDGIFPALPAAKPYIAFDGRGFLVRGKRTFLVAGELQYPRTPRALWRDRLLRIKRAGYNTVQTYAFWNYHESTEGRFDFSGEKDLDAYLKLVHSLGLYAIVRMGPYVNAEWDTGGLPVWLRFNHPGLLPMTDNRPFYKAVTPYFNKLVPILAANQINHGGPILMIQLENEHTLGGGLGAGTDLPNPYYRWYYAKMRAMGLEVPLFFSGLNHNDDPAGDSPLDTATRTSPWYSTEFWTGWYGVYGVDPERAKKLERATWKIIAYGGAGYTHYTMVGGTDFGTWNNDAQAASYDFGAPIGQAGDLRVSYAYCKKAAQFATSFQNLLADSVSREGGDGATATDGGSLQVTHRKGRAGEAVFLYNRPENAPVRTQITLGGARYPSAGPIMLAPGEMVPVLRNYALAPGVTLSLAAARLLGAVRHGSQNTLIAYGNPGEPVELHFRFAGGGGESVLQTTVPSAAPRVSMVGTGTRKVRVLTMSLAMADRTWFLEDGSIACGPDYVGEVQKMPNGTVQLVTERTGPTPPARPLPMLLYPADARKAPQTLIPVVVPGQSIASARPPALGPWRADASVPFVQPAYNDKLWKSSATPLPMGADGDISAYAWYRTTVSAPAAGTYQLNLSSGNDWASCFVNGTHAASADLRSSPRAFPVMLKAGPNSVAFLTAHYGRDKLFNYYGPMDGADAKWKGITGPVTLTRHDAKRQDLNAFRWQADDAAPGDAAKQAAPGLDTSGPGWSDATTSTDVFGDGRLGWVWFRTALPDVPGPHRNLFFHSIDDVGIVYLNGKLIAPSVGLNADMTVPLDAAWHEGGPNVLAVAVQNTGGPGGLTGEVRLDSGLEDGPLVTGWKMRGGVSYAAFTSPRWKPLGAVKTDGVPTFYHTRFTVTPPGESGPHPILRVATTTLSAGFVWLNGVNLGRYPEKSPVDGVYLPEPLLRPGNNDLVIFDENGLSPSNVRIVTEAAANRTGIVLTAASPR